MVSSCKILGHKSQNTLLIEKSDDFYEVDWTTFCARCGKLNPEENVFQRKALVIQRIVSAFLF